MNEQRQPLGKPVAVLGSGSHGWWQVHILDAGIKEYPEYGAIAGLKIAVDASWGWSYSWDLSADCALAMRSALNNWQFAKDYRDAPAIENLYLPFRDGEPRYHILHERCDNYYYVRDRMTGMLPCRSLTREHATRIADALNMTEGHPTLYRGEYSQPEQGTVEAPHG